MAMAMFVGTSQLDNGPGEFCQNTVSRALILASSHQRPESGEQPHLYWVQIRRYPRSWKVSPAVEGSISLVQG
jgi:hypothetical protein